MSDARFALERLNRELRDAVPGSVRIEDAAGNPLDQGACTCASGPLPAVIWAQLASGGLTIVEPGASPGRGPGHHLPPRRPALNLEQGCLHGNCVARVISVGSPVSGQRRWMIPSPRSAGAAHLFCPSAGALLRDECRPDPCSAAIGTDFHGSTPALMAEHIRPAPITSTVSLPPSARARWDCGWA